MSKEYVKHPSEVLKVGDIIVKIDGIEINKMNDLRKYIYSKSPGDKVILLIEREGKEIEMEVELGQN